METQTQSKAVGGENATVHLTVNGQTTRLRGYADFSKDPASVRFGEMQGYTSTQTAFTVWQTHAEMVKTGEFCARFCFCEGKSETVELHTAMGDVPVTVKTTRFALKTQNDSLFLRLNYVLSDGVQDQLFSVTLRVRAD